MSTYSTNLALTLIGNGEQAGNWGQTTNTNLGVLLEQAISGYTTQAILDTGVDTTLAMTQGATATARNMYIELTGSLSAARNLVVPNNKKLYFIWNNTTGGFAVTVKVSGGSGVSVPSGFRTILVCNGVDIYPATTAAATGVTQVNTAGNVNGLTLTGGPITGTGTITLGGSLSGTASGLTVGNATNASFATTAGSISGTLGTGQGGTGSSSLAGAGIPTFSANNTFSGTNTFNGITNFTTLANFTTAQGGASFGQATPNGNYAIYCQPNASSGIGGLATQGTNTYIGHVALTQFTSIPMVGFFYGTPASGVGVGSITTNGSITAYVTSSDYRLKENITPLANAVTRLKQLAPKNFTWKNNPSLGTTEGFIAHELDAVVPDAVFGEKDAVDQNGNPKYQGVDSSILIPLLTAALQEALVRIEALEAKVG